MNIFLFLQKTIVSYFVAVCAEENMYDCKSDFIEKQIPKWKCVCAQIKENKIISKNIG